MFSQLPIHVIFEVVKFLQTDQLLVCCLLSKNFLATVTSWTKDQCLRWWRSNLDIHSENLAIQFDLEKIFSLLQQEFGIFWRTLWQCLSNSIDIWSLPDNKSIMCHEKSSLFLRIGKLITRPNVHLRWCDTSPWAGALWMWAGPHIKIEHNRIRKSDHYQLVAVHHFRNDYVIQSGLVIINKQIHVKGLFYVGTHHIDDDFVECLFLIKVTEMYRNNDKIERTDTCEKTTDIGFFCVGCKTFFCFCCQFSHKCKEFKFILLKEPTASFKIVYASIKCGESDKEADIQTSVEQSPDNYYIKGSKESSEIPALVWKRTFRQ